MAERLGFADRAAADADLAEITAGTTTFDALVTDSGLTLDDVDQGELAASDVSDAIAEALFASDEPGLVGPVDTDLGPAIYRVNAVLSATEVPLEDVADVLRADKAATKPAAFCRMPSPRSTICSRLEPPLMSWQPRQT